MKGDFFYTVAIVAGIAAIPLAALLSLYVGLLVAFQ